jgi:hypothetical protein
MRNRSTGTDMKITRFSGNGSELLKNIRDYLLFQNRETSVSEPNAPKLPNKIHISWQNHPYVLSFHGSCAGLLLSGSKLHR